MTTPRKPAPAKKATKAVAKKPAARKPAKAVAKKAPAAKPKPAPKPPAPKVPKVIDRAGWGAKPALHVTPRTLDAISAFYVHYSDTHESIPSPSEASDEAVIRAIQAYHFSRGYADIAYAALVGGDGTIYLGRPNDAVQAAVYGHNHDEWSVCLLTDGPATPAQEFSVRFLLYLGVLNFHSMSHTPLPHSAAVATACPGDELRAWIASLGHVA